MSEAERPIPGPADLQDPKKAKKRRFIKAKLVAIIQKYGVTETHIAMYRVLQDMKAAEAYGESAAAFLERARSTDAPLNFEVLLHAVSTEVGVTKEAITGARRIGKVVMARQLLVCLIRNTTEMSYPEIAAKMQRKSHSSVLYAHKAALKNKELKKKAKEIETALRSCGQEYGEP